MSVEAWGRWIAQWAKGAWVYLPPIAVYILTINQFPYPPGEDSFSDLAVSHLPNLLYFRSAIVEWRTVPLWSPNILSGYPFAANPISGLWYPPGWLALLLPVPFGFNLLVIAHLVFGGVGMRRLLGQSGVSSGAATFGAWAFMAMPKLMGHYAAGHLTLLYAVPLTPWLLVTARDDLNGRRQSLLSGLLLALVFLADSRWAFFATLLMAAWSLSQSQSETAPIWTRAVWLGKQLFVGALITAPLALPLLEYALLSSRSAMTTAEQLVFSLPPERLLALVFPDFGGNQEWMLYPGVILMLLFVLGAVRVRADRNLRFWVVVSALSIYLALGEHAPGLVWLAKLPGFSLLRVPSRVLFITGMAFSVIGSCVLDQLLHFPDRTHPRIDRLALSAAGFFIILTSIGVITLTGRLLQPYVWAGSMALITVSWLIFGMARRIDHRVWLAGIYVLGLLDWTAVQRSLVDPRPVELVVAEKGRLAQSLTLLAEKPASGLFRTYSPSYSLPQHTAARFALQMADGVDPLQLAAYVRFMENATGVPQTGYSVTLPPFQDGRPAEANAAYQPDAELLGLLNVIYVLAEYELSADGLEFISRIDGTYLYKNTLGLPRGWIEVEGNREGELGGRLRITHWSPNVIQLEADGPGTLIVSEINYPGWNAFMDGVSVPILPAYEILRSVRLRPGINRIAFRYQPVSVFVGLFLAILGVAMFLFQEMRQRSARRVLTSRGDTL